MVQRISTATRYAQLVADMQMNQFNYNKLTAQLSSGKKLTSISDDPIASVNVLNTNRQLGRIETYQENVGLATSELSALDDYMELARGYLQTAWDKAVQANNLTYNGDSLKAIKTEIDEITKTMVDLANSEYDDNYIFAGANTKLVPYELGEDGYITYHGTKMDNPDYIRQTEVADGVFEVINTTGDRVFGYFTQEEVSRDSNGEIVTLNPDDNKYYYEDGTECTDTNITTQMEDKAVGVMGALRQLSNGLEKMINGNTSEGYDEIHATLDMFADAHTNILNQQTKFGGVYNRMEMTTSTLETTGDNLTSYLTDLNSIDYPSAITQWLNAQYAYQASLQVASSSMNMSLLNYL